MPTFKPTTQAYYDRALSAWICVTCNKNTDFCVCQAITCPDVANEGHDEKPCPKCKGEGVCFMIKDVRVRTRDALIAASIVDMRLTRIFRAAGRAYGKASGGGFVDFAGVHAGRVETHDHLAAFLVREIVSAYEAAECRRGREQLRAVINGLSEACKEVEAVITGIQGAHIEWHPTELKQCARCKQKKPYSGDWYADLCPECADQTEPPYGNDD